MHTFRMLTAAMALTALGAAAPVLADQHDQSKAGEHTQPTHTQGSQSETATGGSAQVPGTRDGAEATSPYDDVGHDDVDNPREDAMEGDQPVNE